MININKVPSIILRMCTESRVFLRTIFTDYVWSYGVCNSILFMQALRPISYHVKVGQVFDTSMILFE